MKGKAWTAAETTRAVSLYRRGNDLNTVAAKLDRTPRGVKHILSISGVLRPKQSTLDGNLGCYDGPPIAECRESAKLRRNAVQGSARLLTALQCAGFAA